MEVEALMRMTQIMASGGEVDVIKFIGEHECANKPPSLFDKNGEMRAPRTKANLVRVLKEDTQVTPETELPQTNLKTCLIIDGMHAIRKWSFQKEEPFPAVSTRYRNSMLDDVPSGTGEVHFCCDRYDSKSLKSAERHHRGEISSTKLYHIDDQYRTPDPSNIFNSSDNKAAFLNYICTEWERDELADPQLDIKLYLSGGFEDAERSIMLTEGSSRDVPDLESSQEEADTRIMLHAMYATTENAVERVFYMQMTLTLLFSVSTTMQHT